MLVKHLVDENKRHQHSLSVIKIDDLGYPSNVNASPVCVQGGETLLSSEGCHGRLPSNFLHQRDPPAQGYNSASLKAALNSD